MNIVGFGDSFMANSHCEYLDSSQWPEKVGYLATVGKHFNANVETYGFGGSSFWDAFFEFEKYMREPPDKVDVVIFAWTESSRLYHSKIRNICSHAASMPMDKNDPDAAVWLAAKHYYTELYSHPKIEYEAAAFYQWFDKLSETYTNIKFIHMWSFAKDVTRKPSWWEMYDEDSIVEYHHRFQNGAEIRPALMNFSKREGWPKGNDTPNDMRQNHLSPKYHEVLASIIVDAIENYEPGKIFTEKKI